jgi:hypothetical protein
MSNGDLNWITNFIWGIADVSAWLRRGPCTTLLARPDLIALLTRFCQEQLGATLSVRMVAQGAGNYIYELAPEKKP